MGSRAGGVTTRKGSGVQGSQGSSENRNLAWALAPRLHRNAAGCLMLVMFVASCAGRIPTADEANQAVLTLREYGSWAWALGIVLIWADLVAPVSQTAMIAALGIIYGVAIGGVLGTFGLVTSGLL